MKNRKVVRVLEIVSNPSTQAFGLSQKFFRGHVERCVHPGRFAQPTRGDLQE